jgi:PAS domain S-box-containing protein
VPPNAGMGRLIGMAVHGQCHASHLARRQYAAVDTPAVLIVNASGVIQSWSPGAEDLIGHSQSSVVGKTLDVIVPEDFRQRHWAGFHRAIASGNSFIDGQAAILPVLCADGQVHHLAGRLSLLRDPTGRVVGAMAIYTSSAGLESQLPALGD